MSQNQITNAFNCVDHKVDAWAIHLRGNMHLGMQFVLFELGSGTLSPVSITDNYRWRKTITLLWMIPREPNRCYDKGTASFWFQDHIKFLAFGCGAAVKGRV